MRPLVSKYLSYWQTRLKQMGEAVVKDELLKGKTILIGRKDRMQLLQELNLREKRN